MRTICRCPLMPRRDRRVSISSRRSTAKSCCSPDAIKAVPTGIALALPAGVEAQVRPRSGLALKHGITVLNAPGTIDSDYRGEVNAILINHGATPFTITRGMKIAQLVVAAHARVEWSETTALNSTARGTAGFGSTGLTVEQGERRG